MKITRPIPGQGGAIAEITHDVEGTVLDPEMDTGYIDLPCPVLSWESRVHLFGDGEPLIIDPAGYEPTCRQIAVPKMPVFDVANGLVALDAITYRADNLVRACETGEPIVIQRSVTKYHDELVSRLTGKSGLLSRRIYGVRCSNSLRAVVAPGRSLSAEEIGLPEKAAARAGIVPGDIVLLSRPPILWQGSVLAMRVVYVPGHALRLNAWCTNDLNADFDGDQCSVIKWPANVPEPDRLGPENPVLPIEVERTTEWRGQSLKPSEILARTGFAAAFAEDKEVPEDIDKYVRGLTEAEYMAKTEEVVLSIAGMKMHLGIVGSITDKICALVPDDLLPAALRAKERLTQALLDSKHGEGCLGAEQLSETFESGDEMSIRAALMAADVDIDEGQAITKALVEAGVPPLTLAFREKRPDLATIKGSCNRIDLLRTIETVRGWSKELPAEVLSE
jgi:hypothetical protein